MGGRRRLACSNYQHGQSMLEPHRRAAHNQTNKERNVPTMNKDQRQTKLEERRMHESLERAKARIEDDNALFAAFAYTQNMHKAAMLIIGAAENAVEFHNEGRWISLQDAFEVSSETCETILPSNMPDIRRVLVACIDALMLKEEQEAKNNVAESAGRVAGVAR